MDDNKKKVLLVEDDSMIVEMYKLRLEEEGFIILTTDKGSKAIEMAAKEQPAIVLLDIILPEIDGFTILRSIKSANSTKNIPVVLLTNLSQESDRQKGAQLGAADYFVKAQHTPADIMNEIKKILKY